MLTEYGLVAALRTSPSRAVPVPVNVDDRLTAGCPPPSRPPPTSSSRRPSPTSPSTQAPSGAEVSVGRENADARDRDPRRRRGGADPRGERAARPGRPDRRPRRHARRSTARRGRARHPRRDPVRVVIASTGPVREGSSVCWRARRRGGATSATDGSCGRRRRARTSRPRHPDAPRPHRRGARGRRAELAPAPEPAVLILTQYVEIAYVAPRARGHGRRLPAQGAASTGGGGRRRGVAGRRRRARWWSRRSYVSSCERRRDPLAALTAARAGGAGAHGRRADRTAGIAERLWVSRSDGRDARPPHPSKARAVTERVRATAASRPS